MSFDTSRAGIITVTIGLVALVMGQVAVARPYVYPSKGQSAEQQRQAESDCHHWARQQTGFDPMQQPRATSAPPHQQAQQGGVLRGAARGATLGVIGGAIGGNAGRGAAIGAATGALIGGMRRRDQQRQQQQAQRQWEQHQAAQQQHARGEYDRAYGACLAGRGYTIR